MYIFMIATYIIIAAFDSYRLVKEKKYGKLAVYYSLMILSAAVGTLAGNNVKIPNPLKPVENMIKAIVGI